MTALVKPGRVPDRYGVGVPVRHSLPVAAGQNILPGALVCMNAAGFAVNATVATTLVAVGISIDNYDNTNGADGDVIAEQIESGVFDFANSAAGDLIVETDKFKDVFIVDNQTVAKTNGTNTRSRAGQLERIENGRVYVHINPLAKGA